MLKKRASEKEKDKRTFIEKIKNMDRYDLILIIGSVTLIPLICFLIFLMFRTDKKTINIKPQAVVQKQILSKEQFNKNK